MSNSKALPLVSYVGAYVAWKLHVSSKIRITSFSGWSNRMYKYVRYWRTCSHSVVECSRLKELESTGAATAPSLVPPEEEVR